MVNRCKL